MEIKGYSLEMKKISILALALLSLVSCSNSNEKKTAMEWAKIAVEEEHYILDDDGILLTHTAVTQTPSLELVEEVEGETYGDYLYVKDDDGDYYVAFFKHSLVVETYYKIKEYVYISAIVWRFEIKSSNPIKLKFTEDEIVDIDIAELEW